MFRPQRSSKFRNYNNNARQYARPPRPPPAPFSPWDCNPWINFGPVPPGMVPYPPYEPQGNHEMFNMPPPGPPLPVFVNYAMHDPYMMPQLYQPPIPQSHQPPIPHTLQPPMPVHDVPDQAAPLDQYQSFPVPQFQPAMMPPPLQYFPHLMTAPVAAPYPFINLKPQRRPRAIPIIDPHTHEDILLKIYNDFTYPPPPSSPEDKQRFLPNETPMNEHSEQLEWSDAEPTSAEQQLPPPTNVNSFVMNETNITVLAEQAATPLSEQAAMSLAEQAATPLAEQAVMPLAEQAATSLTDETTTPLTEQTPMIIADQTPTPLTEQTPKLIADQAPNPLTEQTPTIIADQTPTPLTKQVATPLTEQLATPLTEQLATPLTEQLATSLTEQARTPFEDLTPMQFTDQDVTSFAEQAPTTLEEQIPEEFFSYSVHRRYRRSRLRPFLPAIPEEPAVISQWCSNVMASEVKEEKAASPIDSDQSYDADESSSTPEPVLSPQDQLMAVIGNAKESKYRRKCAKKALARILPAAQSSSSSSQEDAARFRKLGATFERVRTVRIQRGRQVSSSAISLDNCRGKEQSLPAKGVTPKKVRTPKTAPTSEMSSNMKEQGYNPKLKTSKIIVISIINTGW